MLERNFQPKVKAYLESIGFEGFTMTSGALTARGISDLVGTLPGGRSIYVEVKKEGGSPSAQQKNFLAKMARLGAFTAIVYPLPRKRPKPYPDHDGLIWPEGFEEFKKRLEQEMNK